MHSPLQHSNGGHTLPPRSLACMVTMKKPRVTMSTMLVNAKSKCVEGACVCPLALIIVGGNPRRKDIH